MLSGAYAVVELAPADPMVMPAVGVMMNVEVATFPRLPVIVTV